jgi:hypothetical protein
MASRHHIQGAVTAIFDLVEQHDVVPAYVKHVRLALSKVPFDMHGGFATVAKGRHRPARPHRTAAKPERALLAGRAPVISDA